MFTTKQRRGVYPKEQLVNAIRAVSSGKMTSFKASALYKVPSSTIRCHVNGYTRRIGAGALFYLTEKQEDFLVKLIKSFEAIGLRLTKFVLMKVAGQYCLIIFRLVNHPV